MALGIIKKFYSERRVRRAVQATLDIGVTATACHRGDNWIILQVVWSGIHIAIIIRCDAAVAIGLNDQIDPEAAIREDRIAKNGVVDGSVARDAYSDEIWSTTHGAVEGDDVAYAAHCAADCVVVTNNADSDRVDQGLCAGDIGTDDVTLDDSAVNIAAKKHTKVTVIARDEVTRWRARSCRQSADDIIRAADIETDSTVPTRQSDCSSDVRADEVALHHVVRVINAQGNVAAVAGDDVTRIDGCAADEHIGGTAASANTD